MWTKASFTLKMKFRDGNTSSISALEADFDGKKKCRLEMKIVFNK